MDATDTLVEVLKGEGPRVLATLARTIGDLAVAEDALSEATITALDAWPKTGIPDNPRAWLAVVARRAWPAAVAAVDAAVRILTHLGHEVVEGPLLLHGLRRSPRRGPADDREHYPEADDQSLWRRTEDVSVEIIRPGAR